MFFVRQIRANPFSTIALCSIAGDMGYLGFAFHAQGWVSGPKLLGSLFTLAAHIVLLAYGDDLQSRRIAEEKSFASRIIGSLRQQARRIVLLLPRDINEAVRARPVGIPFAMLAMNGVGLLTDSLFHDLSFSVSSQFVLGLCITLGCGAFALADFHPGQRVSNALLKAGPVLLTCATAANGLVAIGTLNVFMIFSTVMFLISNLAGFYTKIDKQSPVIAKI